MGKTGAKKDSVGEPESEIPAKGGKREHYCATLLEDLEAKKFVFIQKLH